MTKKNIEDIGRQIVADTLGIAAEECDDNANLADDLGADSLDAIDMIMRIENKFDITVEEGEAEQVKTVKDFLDLLVIKVKPDEDAE